MLYTNANNGMEDNRRMVKNSIIRRSGNDERSSETKKEKYDLHFYGWYYKRESHLNPYTNRFLCQS